MRKLLVLFLLVPLLTVAAAEVDDPSSPGEEQWGFVQGTIELPTRLTNGESGWPGLGRGAWLCSPTPTAPSPTSSTSSPRPGVVPS